MAAPVRRTYFLNYLGHCDVHRVYSKPMLPWIVAEANFCQDPAFCSLTIDQNACTAKKEKQLLIDSATNEKHGVETPLHDNDVSGFSHPLEPIDAEDEQSSNSLNCLPLTFNLEHVAEIIVPSTINSQCIGVLKTPHDVEASYVCHVFQSVDDNIVSNFFNISYVLLLVGLCV